MPTSRFFLVRATLAFWVLSVGYAFVQVETMRKVSMAAALYRRQSLSASLGSKGSNQDATASSRRRFLGQMGTLSLVNLIIPSDPAVAAAPITIGESENVGARVRRLLRPKPPKVLRNQLNLDFAVLLMRSSYNALDQIDCVAMDQFQRDFFILVSLCVCVCVGAVVDAYVCVCVLVQRDTPVPKHDPFISMCASLWLETSRIPTLRQ